jgi:hypothetical protein
MHRTLVGGHVQRVVLARLQGREVALLRVRVPGDNVYLVLAGGTGAGGGCGALGGDDSARLRDAMREAGPQAEGGGPPPQRGFWRARVEGARVVGVGARTVSFSREDKLWCARADPGGQVRLEPGDPAKEAAEGQAEDAAEEELYKRGARIAEHLGREGTASRSELLRRALARAIARVDRRVEAVRGDLARAETADEMAARAQLFVVAAAQAPRGATRLVAVDWSSGEARDVEWALDPARGAREQIDALFQRARRLKEGARISRTRLADAEQALAALRDVASALALPEADVDALEARARAAAPRDFKLAPGASAARPRDGRRVAAASAPGGGRSADRPRQQALPPYRTFASAGGARILVGRGAEKNDALTFHVARPHDLWLHAKNRAGAHVIVPLDKGASCPADVLVDAAHLAAHFSEARDERVVEVQYTPRRYLRKPRGSAPGLVVVDREKVLVLRREDERLRQVLGREEEPPAGAPQPRAGRRPPPAGRDR